MKNNLKGWKIVKLEDVGEIITGTTPSTKIEGYWGNGMPFVTPTDFSENKYVNVTERTVTIKGAEMGRVIPKDTVMVTCIASVGEVAMASTECITNQQINSIVCKEGVNPDFVYYSMVFNKQTLKRWAGVTTSPIIKKSLFEQFPIFLSTFPEQKKIAEILSTVDEAIEKVNQKIEKTNRLKTGLMRKLLTEGIGHKEFKNTEIGRIPTNWELTTIGNISNGFSGGGTPSTSRSDYWDGRIPWMTSAHINGKVVNSGQRYITEKGLKGSATNLIEKGNLLVATRVGIGKVVINLVDMAISQDLTGILIKKDLASVDYLYWFLRNNSSKLKSIAQGSTIKGILKDDLANMKIFLPPLPEQHKIAEILSTVDDKLEQEEKRKQKLERVKKYLMEVLLTGKKRVKI